ncbi:Conserved_hypothetical protein [Hexamita inflata]|uniref:Uncharacterized protein n=1 Tax=Hexamita inflata TaxID=28002 RepID=A0AA86PPV5_9EUKA|nr:Conserved hypothetical protein [Hexamita inflata]CAI9938927.1 Conserved hypothetical protein [Hexamita inflata]
MIEIFQILMYTNPLCDSVNIGLVWGAYYNCDMSNIVDSSVTTAQGDLSVANVLDLQKLNNNFSLANFTGQINNMYIFVNTSILVTDPISYITIFDYISGSMRNVTLSGFINITIDTSNAVQIFLAPFGNFLYDQTTLNTKFTQIKSDLQFMVNGMRVQFDRQWYNGTIKTRLLSNFNEIADSFRKLMLTSPILNYAALLKQKIIFCEIVNKIAYYSGFQAFYKPNLHTKLYELPLKTILDYKQLLNGATEVKLDSNENQVTDDSFTKIVYTTDVQAFVPNGLMCSQTSYFKYDGSCTTNTACGGSIFKQMCLKACPLGLFTMNFNVDSVNYCVEECPKHLGYLTSGQYCVYSPSSSCSGGETLFLKGCYSNMPSGLISWSEPSSYADCFAGSFKYFVQKSKLGYNYCTNTIPRGFYFRDKTVTSECSDFILPTGECAFQCLSNQILNIIGDSKFCLYTCSINSGTALVNSNGVCSPSCSDNKYVFKSICLSCIDVNDGGPHFNQTSLQCMTCAQVKYTKMERVCTNSCPYLFNSVCYDSCPPQTFTDGSNCVLACANQIQGESCSTCALSFNKYCRTACNQFEYQVNGQCKSRSRARYGRVWNYTESYNLDEIGSVDLNILDQTNGDPTIPLNLVNVYSLSLFGSSYNLLRVNSGSVKNGKFVVNVTLDFSVLTQPDETIVCLFESVNGVVSNVEVTGEVRIKNLQPRRQIVLSNAFGSVLLRNSERVNKLLNIKTSLKYFIDDVQVTSNGIINGVQVVLVSSREEAMTDAQLAPFTAAGLKIILDSAEDIQTQINKKTLVQQEIKLVDETIKVYTLINASDKIMQNAFADYYTSPLLQQKQQSNDINGMKQYNFDFHKNIIELLTNQEQILITVFTTQFKAIVQENNQFSFKCQGNYIVDISTLTCIQRSACNKFILDAMCLNNCLKGQYYVAGSTNICFDECPHYNGYRNPVYQNLISKDENSCIQCPNFAYQDKCLTACASYHFTFQSGCYNTCPEGTLSSGQTCSSPTSSASCAPKYFVKQSVITLQYLYDICSSIKLHLYKDSSNTYLPICSGKILLDETCDTTSLLSCTNVASITNVPLSQMISGNNICTLQCYSGFTNSSGLCLNACSELYYQQYFSGNCLTCQQNVYDSGTFWSRLTKQCVSSCLYVNRTLCSSSALNPFDLTKCIFKLTDTQIIQISCIRACQYLSLQSQIDICIQLCPQLNLYIDQLDYPICEQYSDLINCPRKLVIADSVEYSCIEICPSYSYIYLDFCLNSCPALAKFTDGISKTCNPCDGSQGAQMKYKIGLICSSTPCAYYINFVSNECSVGTCSETGGNYINQNGNKICAPGCPLNQKFYNGNCYQSCPANAPFLQITGTQCDIECNGQTIYQIGDQKNCLTSCDPSYFLGQAEAGYQICVNCTSDQIAQRSDNHCILRTNCVYFSLDSPICESGLGLNCPKILVRDSNSFFCRQNCSGYLEYQDQCYSKCPVNTIMDVSGTTCVTICSFYRLVTFSGILQAQCQTDTCTDFQYIDLSIHDTVSGCYVNCPAETLKTRTNTCVKDCVIFDVYPIPTYCEIPGTPSCLNFRKVSGTSVFICATCTPKEFLNGFECALNCDGQFVQLSNKSICQSTCGCFPKGYTEETFNSVSVNVCQNTCPVEFPYYDIFTLLGTQRCFNSNCGPNGKFLEVNQKCVSICASGNYFINYSSQKKFQCKDFNESCDRYYRNNGMKECYLVCPLIYPFLNGNECLKSCDPYMNDPKSPTQKLCLSSCGGVNPPFTLTDAEGRTQCTSSCGDLFVQQAGKKFSCVSFCQFYTWDGSSKKCTQTCEYYRIDPTKDKLAYWCSDTCAALNMTYSVADGSGKNKCVSFCPAAYPFLDGTVCKNYCLFIVEQIITDVSKFKCISSCPKFHQLYPTDSSIRICRQNCVGSVPYVFGSQCVSNCGLTINKYVGSDGLTCVSTCSGETAMNETAAVWFCDSRCDFYADSGARTCSSAGTAGYPYRQVYQQIVSNAVTTTRYQYVTNCPNNEYAVVGGVSVCQTCTLYELVGAAHKCVSSCSASQVQFKYQCFTGLCKDIVGVGSSFYSGVDKKCSQTCGDHFVYDQVSFQCSPTCPANSVYFVSGSQQICSFSCAGTNDYVTLDFRYAINGVGQCVQICPVGSFKELLQAGETYKYCASQCTGKQYKVVAGEQICVSTCPVYAMEAGGVKRCYDSCGDSAQNKIQVIISGSETQCVSLCPPSHPFMAANGGLECIQTCPNLFYSLVGNVRKCLDSCYLNASVEVLFSVPSHQLCIGACGDQQMFLRDSGSIGTCVEVCPLTKNYYDSNRECQAECVPKVYRIDGAQKQCMASCSPPYNRIVVDNDYQQCNLYCTGLTPYTKLDNVCVSLCPVGTYLHDLICKLLCPSTMKYALFQSGHHICSTTCPSKIFSSQSGVQNLFCQDSCLSPNLFRNEVSSGYTQCINQCGAGEYQHSTRECNSRNCLQDPTNKFVSNWVCLLVCPDFVDLSDYSCKATCSGSFSGYVQQVLMSQNSRVCHPTCPTNFIDLRASSQYQSAGVCVTYCPTTETLYQEPFSVSQFYCMQKCSDANRFVQPDLVYCGNTCASTFFQQNETGHNFCISSCDMPLGRLSIYGITKCMVCPKYVSEVDQACLAACDFSNVSFGAQICRMAGGVRNTVTCPVYTNNAAPFLCIYACFTMRDGPWCVQDCSVTGKRFVPESGFDCASSCPYFYEFQQIFGVEQPRCNQTCDYMLSSANLQECQRKCYSNTSVYVFGLTYCSNCSSTQKLLVQANKLFSCISTACPDSTFSKSNLCSYVECGDSQVQTTSQLLTGYVCADPFSFNITTTLQSVTNLNLNVSQIQAIGFSAYILLQNVHK